MEKHSQSLKIPKERIAVLIGTKGDIKKELEENTDTNINVDSEEGDVTIIGEDPLKVYTANEVVKAIARGFNPNIAQLLLKQDYSFILLDLSEICKQSEIKRVKGRVIGKEGRSRENIERLTECNISVYGKTIGIIGRNNMAIMAKDAIESLIRGKPHSKVYAALERQRREMKIEPL
jgi:ribosomal RNA assembly protein